MHDTCIPSPPFAYFLISGYLLRAPDNDPITRTFFCFPRRFELSGVDCIASSMAVAWWLLMAVSWGICLKLNYSRHQIKRTLLQSFPPLFPLFLSSKSRLRSFLFRLLKNGRIRQKRQENKLRKAVFANRRHFWLIALFCRVNVKS